MGGEPVKGEEESAAHAQRDRRTETNPDVEEPPPHVRVRRLSLKFL